MAQWAHNWSDWEIEGHRAFIVFRPNPERTAFAYGMAALPRNRVDDRKAVALTWRTAREAVYRLIKEGPPPQS
jgi:hypothetical protein